MDKFNVFYYADNLKVSTIVSINFYFENSPNSCCKLALKLRICVRFATTSYVECVAVLTMTWSYVRIVVIWWLTLSTNEKKVKGHGWLTGLSRYNE